MKKNSYESLLYSFVETIGKGFIIGGILILVSALFASLSNLGIVTGSILIALGIIICMITHIYFIFVRVLDVIEDLLEKARTQNSPPMNYGTSPQPSTEIIKIDETTTPGEIEEIKKKHPLFSSFIDNAVNRIRSEGQNISSLSVQQLEKKLKEAIDNNEFEKAAKIRDEINKKKP